MFHNFSFLPVEFSLGRILSKKQQRQIKRKKGKKRFSLLPTLAENWDSGACEGQFVEADLPILSLSSGSKEKEDFTYLRESV